MPSASKHVTARNVSFEFFAPRSEGQTRRFWRTLGSLETLSPEWISITWGALGSSSDASRRILESLSQETDLAVAAHLTCLGETTPALEEMLQYLESLGITRLVALRGDAAVGQPVSHREDEPICRHAIELVELAARMGSFDISVAAYPDTHPEASSSAADIQFLKAKMDAGASRAITQFFFDVDRFLGWRDRAVSAGIDKPIVAGILPIHDIDKVIDFAGRCGTAVPATLINRFKQVKSADARRKLAVDTALDQCTQLQREGIDDFHLYTLNQSDLALSIGRQLSTSATITEAA